MKNNSLLMKHCLDLKPIRVIIDGEDFGLYIFNKESQRYEGIIGHINIADIAKIISKDTSVNHIKIQQA